jgi:hypothetical protein
VEVRGFTQAESPFPWKEQFVSKYPQVGTRFPWIFLPGTRLCERQVSKLFSVRDSLVVHCCGLDTKCLLKTRVLKDWSPGSGPNQEMLDGVII